MEAAAVATWKMFILTLRKSLETCWNVPWIYSFKPKNIYKTSKSIIQEMHRNTETLHENSFDHFYKKQKDIIEL